MPRMNVLPRRKEQTRHRVDEGRAIRRPCTTPPTTEHRPPGCGTPAAVVCWRGTRSDLRHIRVTSRRVVSATSLSKVAVTVLPSPKLRFAFGVVAACYQLATTH
eukprot:scaffold57487_cov61-Phaeocystis_antarctica.AAC.6